MRGVFTIKAAFALAIILIVSATANGQTGVSINASGSAPDANSILDVTSTSKGVLLPRVTTAERTAISPTSASDFGMLVYDTDTDNYWYWDGTAWQEIPNVSESGNTLDEAYDEGGAGSGRVITGDAGAVDIQGVGGLLVNGNVGVGTTSQAQKLIVSSTTTGDANILIEADTDNNDENAHPQLRFSQDGGAVTGFLGYESDVVDNNVIYLSNQWTDPTGDVRIRTQDLDRVTVEGTGNVGIGLTNPAYNLDVVGNTHTSGDFYGDIHVDDTRNVNSPPTTYNNEVAFDYKDRSIIGVPGSGTYSGLMTIAPWSVNSGDASHQINFNEGGLYWRQGQPDAASWGTWYKIITTADGLPTGSGTTNYLARWTPNGNTLGIGTTYDNGTNVGLGTTAPVTKLDVRGQATLGTAFVPTTSTDDNILNIVSGSNATGNQNGISFYENTGGYGMSFGYDGTGSGIANALRFYSETETPLVTIQNGGNVGIGTTTPYAKLNVGDAAGPSIYLTREDNSTVANDVLGSLLFDSTDDTSPSTTDASAGIRALASQSHGNSNKGGHLTFLTKDNVGGTTAATERMRIQSNGNVGIGNTTPGERLVVYRDENHSAEIGRAHVGYMGHSDWAGFSHIDANATGSYALLHNASGLTLVNAASGQDIRFRINNVDQGTFESDGDFGVGTINPLDEVHVSGASDFRIDVDDATYIQVGNLTSSTDVMSVESMGSAQVVIDENNNDNNSKSFYIKKNSTTGTGTDIIAQFHETGWLAVGNPTTGSQVKKAVQTFFEGGTHTLYGGTVDYNFDYYQRQLTLPPGASNMTVRHIAFQMSGLHHEGDENFHIYIDIGGNVAGINWSGGGTLGMSGNNQYMDWNFGANMAWTYTSNQTVKWELYEENETCWGCDNEETDIYDVKADVYYEYSKSLQYGDISASGRIYANSNVEVGDVAEYFPITGSFEVGDIISFVPGEDNRYKQASKAYDSFITGVVSENPSVVLNNPESGEPLALAGRVKVNLAPGQPPVKSGDYLTTSVVPGKAMKASKAGTVIGYAVTDQVPGQSHVMVLLQPGKYYIPMPEEDTPAPRSKFVTGEK